MEHRVGTCSKLLAGLVCVWACALALGLANLCAAQEGKMTSEVPEDVYKGQLIAYPGPWAFDIGKSAIILVSDQELEELSNPDQVLNLSMTFQKREASLRQICERAKAAGQRTLIIAFDQFFKQYRPGQNQPRRLTPDMDEYVQKIAAISKFAAGYGLGLELSLLSPLEIGQAYEKATGESGKWMQYREGVRDPKTGRYSVQLWQQQQWCNNKGPVKIEDAGVRVFAFHEDRIGGTPYRVVDPNKIVEISDTAKVTPWDGTEEHVGEYRARRVQISGEGRTDIGDLDRVLVVQIYRTPEMDYFSDNALPFLDHLVDKYADAGVKLNGLYSDEMHIQQDWGYYHHQDDGEFAMRYVSDGLARKFAAKYGAQYADFAKYLVYFAYGQEDFVNDLTAKEGTMHVFGSSPEAIQATALFRSHYYKFLQDGVVDLFVAAKHHAEERMGHKLEARAHATWAESPTCDYWRVGQQNANRYKYEYTPNFVWSNTVQQSAAACSDYFKWGDFLTGNGNDNAEGGWLDRDYTGPALACSTGIINEVPYSYAAHWGMPAQISQRRRLIESTFGTAGGPFGVVQNDQHRDVSVLMLYPLDLVACEERFGSWMNQYAYTNLITPAKLVELGKVKDGAIEMAGRRFTTLVATFEPFPPAKLLNMMRKLVEQGGRVIWSGPPPILNYAGKKTLTAWENIFGVDYTPTQGFGWRAPGERVTFEDELAGVEPQTILTDFLVDRIYHVQPREGVDAVARVKGQIVGTVRKVAGGGIAAYLGYRPRDDQSASLGYDTRNWFEVLNALGAYPPSGKFAGVDDNTEALSRTSDLLACRFPNGTVTICNQLKSVEEDWDGGFARNAKRDAAYIKRCPPPSMALHLTDYKVNGHDVTYDGTQAVAFREGADGGLLGFCGMDAKQITVDGKTTVFADKDMPMVLWAPIPKERRVRGGGVMMLLVQGTGTVRFPAAGLPASVEVVAQGPTPGSRGAAVASHRDGDALVVDVDGKASGRWLYVVPK